MASVYRCIELTSSEEIPKILASFSQAAFPHWFHRLEVPACSQAILAALLCLLHEDDQGVLIKSKHHHFRRSAELLIWKARHLAVIIKESCGQHNIRPVTVVTGLRAVSVLWLSFRIQV